MGGHILSGIRTHVVTKEYESNWEAIFGKREPPCVGGELVEDECVYAEERYTVRFPCGKIVRMTEAAFKSDVSIFAPARYNLSIIKNEDGTTTHAACVEDESLFGLVPGEKASDSNTPPPEAAEADADPYVVHSFVSVPGVDVGPFQRSQTPGLYQHRCAMCGSDIDERLARTAAEYVKP